MIQPNIFIIFTLMVASLHHIEGLEREMTIQVNAKERECFYEKIREWK